MAIDREQRGIIRGSAGIFRGCTRVLLYSLFGCVCGQFKRDLRRISHTAKTNLSQVIREAGPMGSPVPSFRGRRPSSGAARNGPGGSVMSCRAVWARTKVRPVGRPAASLNWASAQDLGEFCGERRGDARQQRIGGVLRDLDPPVPRHTRQRMAEWQPRANPDGADIDRLAQRGVVDRIAVGSGHPVIGQAFDDREAFPVAELGVPSS